MKKFIAPPRKLLCYLPGFEGGGAERTMINLANTLPAEGWTVRLVVGRAQGAAAQWVAPHTDVTDLRAQRSRQAVFRLRSLVKAWRPDVVFSTLIDGNLAAVAATRGLWRPPAVVVRETNSHKVRGDLPPWLIKAAGWAYRQADHMIALSTGVGSEMQESYQLPVNSISVIANPVDVGTLRNRAGQALREPPPWLDTVYTGDPMAVDDRRPVVLGMGRLHRQKGFERLIDAIALLPDPRPRLILLGTGPLHDELRDQAQALGVDLMLPGFIADPVPWLAHASAFVLSSHWEGFGHVLVEGMACGVPVVSFDCPYGPRDIILSGYNGLLIRDGDLHALAAVLDELLQSPIRRATLRRQGQQAADSFALPTITSRYSKVLASVADAHAAKRRWWGTKR
jgi:glycosyltransferase involved in cell wall biosynthesis